MEMWNIYAMVIWKQEQHQRGTANSIAMTGMSAFKAIGPACAGALWVSILYLQHLRFIHYTMISRIKE